MRFKSHSRRSPVRSGGDSSLSITPHRKCASGTRKCKEVRREISRTRCQEPQNCRFNRNIHHKYGSITLYACFYRSYRTPCPGPDTRGKAPHPSIGRAPALQRPAPRRAHQGRPRSARSPRMGGDDRAPGRKRRAPGSNPGRLTAAPSRGGCMLVRMCTLWRRRVRRASVGGAFDREWAGSKSPSRGGTRR